MSRSYTEGRLNLENVRSEESVGWNDVYEAGYRRSNDDCVQCLCPTSRCLMEEKHKFWTDLDEVGQKHIEGGESGNLATFQWTCWRREQRRRERNGKVWDKARHAEGQMVVVDFGTRMEMAKKGVAKVKN